MGPSFLRGIMELMHMKSPRKLQNSLKSKEPLEVFLSLKE